MSFLKYCLLLILVACSVSTTGEDVDNNLEKAYFAGGCFWCMEESFDKVDGVISVVSGYSGGHLKKSNIRRCGLYRLWSC